MSRIKDIKQEINRIQEQINYLCTQENKLKYILKEFESLEEERSKSVCYDCKWYFVLNDPNLDPFNYCKLTTEECYDPTKYENNCPLEYGRHQNYDRDPL